MRKGAPSVNPSGRAKRSDAARDDAGWVNATTGFGVQGVDKRTGADIVYEPIAPQKGLEYWLADDMGARIVEELPDAAFQEGFELKIGEDKSAQELMPPKPKAKPAEPAENDENKASNSEAAPGVTVNIHAPPAKKPAKRSDADYASAELDTELGEADEASEGESTDTDKPGKEPEELREWLDEQLKTLGAVEKLTSAAKLERACNGAAVLLGALDNGTMDQPLNLETVRSFDWMTIIEAQEMSPVTYYADPSKPKFGEVEQWAITPQSPGPGKQGAETYYPGGRILVHETRLIVFPGIKVSRFQRCLIAGFGDNVWSRVFDVLRDFNNAFGSAAVLVTDFGQAVWAIKGLAQLLSMDGNRAFRDRVAAMELARSALRATVVDAEGESFQRVATPVTGLPDLLSALERRLAAAAGMPITRLMGMSPGGLNATGESDEKYWHARVKSFQVNRLEPALKRIIEILIKVSGQKVDTWCIEWKDLRQLTELEQAQLMKTVAEMDQINTGTGLYTPEEAAVSHFSGDKFKPGVKLDFSARAMAERMEQQEAKMQQELEVAKASGPPGIGGAPAKPAPKADAFDPDQPRDELGRFGEGGGGGDRKAERSARNRLRANDLGYAKINSIKSQKELREKMAAEGKPSTPETHPWLYEHSAEDEANPTAAGIRVTRDAFANFEKFDTHRDAGNIKVASKEMTKARAVLSKAAAEVKASAERKVELLAAAKASERELAAIHDSISSLEDLGLDPDDMFDEPGYFGDGVPSLEDSVHQEARFAFIAAEAAEGRTPSELQIDRVGDKARDRAVQEDAEVPAIPDLDDPKADLMAKADRAQAAADAVVSNLESLLAHHDVHAKVVKAAGKQVEKAVAKAVDEVDPEEGVDSDVLTNGLEDENHPQHEEALDAALDAAEQEYEARRALLGPIGEDGDDAVSSETLAEDKGRIRDALKAAKKQQKQVATFRATVRTALREKFSKKPEGYDEKLAAAPDFADLVAAERKAKK